MRIKGSLSTLRLKLSFFWTHLKHRLKLTDADAVCGKDFTSFTTDLTTHRQKGTIRLGDSVRFGRHVEISTGPGALFELGNHVGIGYSVCIGCQEKITIGDYSMIAEFSTVRDGDHGISKDRPMITQKCASKPITIGKDVWIGAGCAILKGATIPDGCIIGAHSLVTQKSELVPYGIYAGTPVRLIRMR